MATQLVDSAGWGPFEWAVGWAVGAFGALCTALFAVAGFVWSTRMTIAEHERRLLALESTLDQRITRLEEKLDNYHAHLSQAILQVAAQAKD